MFVKKILYILLLSFVVQYNFICFAFADETSDIILQLLIKKGLITQGEVDEMREEVKRQK